MKILFVEDHEDTRELLCELLATSGFDIHGVATAEEGYDELRTGKYGLLITDHWLQGGQTGSWLVNEAARQDILPPTIIVTAERTLPPVPERVAVVKKPVDIDHLLGEIDRISRAAPAPPAPRRAVRLVSSAPTGPARERADEPEIPPPPSSSEELRANRLELVLYITQSQCSLRGLRNLRRFIARYPESRVELAVVDVGAEPLDARNAEDRIMFTPMLVKRAPDAPERLVGDFQDTAPLEDLFVRAGVEPLEGVA